MVKRSAKPSGKASPPRRQPSSAEPAPQWVEPVAPAVAAPEPPQAEAEGPARPEWQWHDYAGAIGGLVFPLLLAAWFLAAHGAIDKATPDADSARMFMWLTIIGGAVAIAGGIFVAVQRNAWAVAGLAGALLLAPLFYGSFSDYSEGGTCGFWACTGREESSTGLNVMGPTLLVLAACAGIGFGVQASKRRPVAASVMLIGGLALAGAFVAAALLLLPNLDSEAAKAATTNSVKHTPGLGTVLPIALAGLALLRRRASA